MPDLDLNNPAPADGHKPDAVIFDNLVGDFKEKSVLRDVVGFGQQC